MNRKSFLLSIIFAFLSVGFATCLSGCSGIGHTDPFDTIGDQSSSKSTDTEADNDAPQSADITHSDLAAKPKATSVATVAEETVAMPEVQESGSRRIRINRIGNLREIFNDSNKYQYAAAERIGIDPISGVQDAYFTRRPLVRIESCQYYELDSLTHSMPFLVPEAARLLADIGKNFNDSLRHRGASSHKIRVTSLLRSAYAVKRLRRVNRNATDSSTHQFGTTFDISYARFHCLDENKRVSDEDLKNLLAEVLLDLRREKRCLVKFERKSPCFHITATGK